MPKNDALIQARIDQKTKDDAALVLSAIGLTVSDAVRLLLKRIAQDKALPFEPLTTPNAETLAAIKEIESGKRPRVKTVDELFEALNA